MNKEGKETLLKRGLYSIDASPHNFMKQKSKRKGGEKE